MSHSRSPKQKPEECRSPQDTSESTNDNPYSIHEMNGSTYLKLNQHNIQYRIRSDLSSPDEFISTNVSTRSQRQRASNDFDKVRAKASDKLKQRGPGNGSLVDSGANGGMLGLDATILEYTARMADVKGIQDYKCNGLLIVTGASLTYDIHGKPLILIMHQYAAGTQAYSIHSIGQVEHYGHKIDGRSRVTGGFQSLQTSCGHTIPLHVRHGLCHIDMAPATSTMLDDPNIPHVVLTNDKDWDPSVLDNEFEDPDIWHDAQQFGLTHDPEFSPYIEPRINDTGQYLQRHAWTSLRILPIIRSGYSILNMLNPNLQILSPYNLNSDGYLFLSSNALWKPPPKWLKVFRIGLCNVIINHGIRRSMYHAGPKV